LYVPALVATSKTILDNGSPNLQYC